MKFDRALDGGPIWSPDRSRIVFWSDREGGRNLFWKAANGTTQEELLYKSSNQRRRIGLATANTSCLLQSLRSRVAISGPQISEDGGSNPLIWSTVTAAVCTLPLAMIFEPQLFPSTIAGFVVLFALAWIAHAGGHSLITFSLAWLPASFSSLTLLIQPVVAGILAWVLLGESLGSWQIVGGLTIISGIAIAKRG